MRADNAFIQYGFRPGRHEEPEDVLKEFSTYDKDLKILTYRVLLNKFNDKYKDFDPSQNNLSKRYTLGVVDVCKRY